MSTIARYLKELDEARRQLPVAIATGQRLMAEVGWQVHQTAHFLERFGMRHASPLAAVHSYELVIRIVKARLDRVSGHTVTVKVGPHIFVLDAREQGHLRCVTFWVMSRPGAPAHSSDIYLELP